MKFDQTWLVEDTNENRNCWQTKMAWESKIKWRHSETQIWKASTWNIYQIKKWNSGFDFLKGIANGLINFELGYNK